MNEQVVEIPLDQIDPPNPQLRSVYKNTAHFHTIVAQLIRDRHVLNSIIVRPKGDRFQVCDGYYRYCASLEAGLETIFAIVREMDDTEYLAKQLEANATHRDTDWCEYAAQLERIRDEQDLTLDEICEIVKKGPAWVRSVLSLNNLHETVELKLKTGELPLGKAKILASLPKPLQFDLLEDAIVTPEDKFRKQIVDQRRKHVEERVKGKIESREEKWMEPRMRNFNEIKSEIASPVEIPTILTSLGITDPCEAANMALKWAFRLDPETVKLREEKMLRRELEEISKKKARLERIKKLKENN